MMPYGNLDPSAANVKLGYVDDATLEQLLDLAVHQTVPEEVLAPIAGPPGWSSLRKTRFREYHQTRRTGLDGEHAEMTFSILDHGKLIGSARLARYAPGVLEAGMWLARSSRGKGLGAEVLRLLCAEAKSRLATQLIAHTTVTNVGAISILRKCGATLADSDANGRIRADFEPL